MPLVVCCWMLVMLLAALVCPRKCPFDASYYTSTYAYVYCELFTVITAYVYCELLTVITGTSLLLLPMFTVSYLLWTFYCELSTVMMNLWWCLLWAIYWDDESVMMNLWWCCRHVVDNCVLERHILCFFCVNCLQVLENECLLLPKCWLISVSVRNRHS
jgi:hypothetical protein